ncbi:MAG: SPOR domain-containing protein [Gemmatimonadota bacterium]
MALTLILLILAGRTLAAQEDSRLLAAVRLAQDGQGDSARAIVLDMLDRTPVSDTLFPQVVYTMGMVARDAADRSRNFRRVAVEFAGSAWADDALLGLAQEDFAAGRLEASARNIERIKADYPTSTLLAVASYWGVRTYFELKRTTQACQWLAQGKAMAADDVELLNQFDFYQPRCDVFPSAALPASPRPTGDTAYTAAQPPPAATPPATPAPASVTTESPAPVTRAGGVFAVQVAAVGNEAAAQGTITALRNAGFEPRIVREGGYIKVRVGHFAQRSQATAAASQVRAKLGGSPFVVEEQ